MSPVSYVKTLTSKKSNETYVLSILIIVYQSCHLCSIANSLATAIVIQTSVKENIVNMHLIKKVS